jgi:F subunit of K+-transporting ATPase (Potass_KdpF)
MKLNPLKLLPLSLLGATEVLEEGIEIWSEGRRQKLPLYLFLALCFNLVVAPVVYAASGNEFSRTQAWALGLLGLGTVTLSVYLFFVMFVPEKF